ncbi:hypothetical protein [Pseudomonas sp.]|uniref:hypothetical protein n=1 Tax=Pseudomonas sp. TaxID=306 RepID=UPI003D6E7A27
MELLSLSNGESYNGVYQANLFRLGVLAAREAAQIVRFYQLADSVRADVLHVDWAETVGILEVAVEIGGRLTPLLESVWQRLKN